MSCCKCLLVFLIFLSPALPAFTQAQETLQQLESRALGLEKKGDAQGALSLWEKAQKLTPDSAGAEDHIGFLLAVLNRREQAIPHFQRAIELDPHFAPAHYHLGIAYLVQQDPNRGIPELQAAVESMPNNFDYRFYLGRAFNDTAHYTEAVAQL